MVIIANSKITTDNKFNKDIFVGDGTNREINIPVSFIKQQDGLRIHNFLASEDKNESDYISASIKFVFERTIENGDQTKLDLWISSGDEKSYLLLKEFSKYADKLVDK